MHIKKHILKCSRWTLPIFEISGNLASLPHLSNTFSSFYAACMVGSSDGGTVWKVESGAWWDIGEGRQWGGWLLSREDSGREYSGWDNNVWREDSGEGGQ